MFNIIVAIQALLQFIHARFRARGRAWHPHEWGLTPSKSRCQGCTPRKIEWNLSFLQIPFLVNIINLEGNKDVICRVPLSGHWGLHRVLPKEDKALGFAWILVTATCTTLYYKGLSKSWTNFALLFCLSIYLYFYSLFLLWEQIINYKTRAFDEEIT